MTRDQAIELVVASLPYPAQIREWDTATEEHAIRFTWRGNRFRFAFMNVWMVEEVDDCLLAGTDLAIMVDHAIKLTYINRRP